MLDMGFIRDIEAIIALLPKKRQTLFFSATMPPEIARLAGRMLTDPAKVTVTPVASTVERVEQRVAFADRATKPELLAQILKSEPVERTLVFTRTKHGADRVVRGLVKAGIAADAIHGNKSQGQRERVLAAFRQGRVRTLVATDIAARGIDVDGISHVVNFDLPDVAETYVHRIGRTARAGKEGCAITLCAGDEMPLLRAIERLIRQELSVIEGHPPMKPTEPRSKGPSRSSSKRPAKNGGGRHRGGRSQRGPIEKGDGIATVAFMKTPHGRGSAGAAPERQRRS
jgi:superfamily II DNA/RNA helicase